MSFKLCGHDLGEFQAALPRLGKIVWKGELCAVRELREYCHYIARCIVTDLRLTPSVLLFSPLHLGPPSSRPPRLPSQIETRDTSKPRECAASDEHHHANRTRMLGGRAFREYPCRLGVDALTVEVRSWAPGVLVRIFFSSNLRYSLGTVVGVHLRHDREEVTSK